MRRSSLAVLLAGALVLSLPVPSIAASPTTVEMRALSYAPSRVTFAAPGPAIRWRNVTSPDRLHDVISSLPDYFGSTLMGSGESYRFRFTAAGTFTYICSIHDVMLGKVEVAPVVAVVTDGGGTRLRVTLGTVPFAVDADYRWTIFLRGPADTKLRYRRSTRAMIVDLPVAEPGPGAWTVMVRLRHRPTATPTSDSPLVTVTVPA